ncbi:peptide methionine sulfoxide reductase MsrA 1 isoform X2 [Perca fluviatilis]|uniref:peptide methionine sulfoxide reductase MsrA 1 isoform X2 n=1 Tax=Perca fluviatilis TaxID=8168 RepID=UPI001962424F|nr:peptide methionine sulfoxide reductase MsrA 1 isoform X2 [Perca fluviatilis]
MPMRHPGRLCHFHSCSKKTVLLSLTSMSQTQTVWLLLVSVSLAAADSMADKTQLPTRDRALKGREEKMVVTGLTGHTEVVRVVFSPKDVSLEELLKRFWESHNPTQGMRQQNDSGTQYRSAIYTSNPTQQELALRSKVAFQQELDKKGYGRITTEIREWQPFYYAEDYHQQYLKKVPKGYCGLKGTGVSCPIGAGKDEL